MLHSKKLIILILFWQIVPAYARSFSAWTFHLDTQVSTHVFSEAIEGTNKSLSQFEFNPVFQLKPSDDWSFFSKPTIVLSPNNNSPEERTFFDLSETYVRHQAESFSIQAGKVIYSWGVMDGYDPLDIINPRQYFDPLHSRKLGALSINLTQAGDTWDYEVIWTPRNQGAQLPGSQSRWLPRQVYIPETLENNLILLLPQNINYRYSSRQELNTALDHNIAVRLQKHSPGIDLALSFYEGVASVPLLQPEVTGTVVRVSPKTVITVDPDVTLNSKNFRIRQGGFSTVVNLRGALLKWVSGYSQSLGSDPLLPGWTYENVLGVEKSFGLGKEGLLIAILQYSHIQSEREQDSNFSLKEIFRRSWILGGRLAWKEVWNFSVLALYDSIHGSHFEELSVARRFRDAWNLSLSTALVQGSRDTPLGVFSDNDSISLSLSRSF